MKILLDECIDRRLARQLIGHAVTTVPQRGWAGIKNGQLVDVAQHEFDVFVTVDRNLPNQQELVNFKIAVVVLHARTASPTFGRLCRSYSPRSALPQQDSQTSEPTRLDDQPSCRP